MVDTLCPIDGTGEASHLVYWAQVTVRGSSTLRIALQGIRIKWLTSC